MKTIAEVFMAIYSPGVYAVYATGKTIVYVHKAIKEIKEIAKEN